MRKTFVAHKIAENGTVRDTLAAELDELRKEGRSIFGINEDEKLPDTFGSRIVDVFYE